jgi:hypothetical protein
MLTIYIVKVRPYEAFWTTMKENIIYDAVSAGECLVKQNCMPSFFSIFSVHTLHLQIYPCSVLFCAIHKGIHACNYNRAHLLSV